MATTFRKWHRRRWRSDPALANFMASRTEVETPYGDRRVDARPAIFAEAGSPKAMSRRISASREGAGRRASRRCPGMPQRAQAQSRQDAKVADVTISLWIS